MKVEELKHIAVLQVMETQTLADLTAVLEDKEYPDGQLVFREGEPADSMYFIRTGCVRIQKGTGDGQKTLAVLEAGDYFGEMGLLNQKPRSASAFSAGGARLLRLSKSGFDYVHRTNSDTALNLLFGMIQTASERIRWLDAQLVAYDEIGKSIGEARDLQGLLDLILGQVSRTCKADWGFLALRSEFTGRLDVRAQTNLTLSPSQLEAVSNGEGFLSLVLNKSEDLLVPDTRQHELFKFLPRLGFETSGLLVSPVIHSDQIVGLIALGSNRPHQFDLNTVNLARGVARQAAQAILTFRRREEEEARDRRPGARS